jgi:hypothetical protein
MPASSRCWPKWKFLVSSGGNYFTTPHLAVDSAARRRSRSLAFGDAYNGGLAGGGILRVGVSGLMLLGC